MSKVILVAVSALVCLWMVSGARAGGAPEITGIRAQQMEDGAYAVDFAISQKLDKSNVNVEFDRNFIRLSLKGVSAYPARTEHINASVLEKVFTYQYQPDLARARVLLTIAASTIKERSSWELTKQGLRIIVKTTPTIAADTLKSKSAANSARAIDPEEEKIVKEILAESKLGGATAEQKAISATEDQPLFAGAATGSGEKIDAKKESNLTRMFASLLLVIGIIGACAVGYRRFVLGKGSPFQKTNRVIEVMASQSMGPKRSIALVKVLDQYMVVGMAGDGMTLLANLGSDVKTEKFLDQTGPGASFSDTFDNAMIGSVSPSRSSDSAGPAITQKNGLDLGIRASIKKRIEGFKPL